MKPTLLILAAGMGSRYGGIKQMDSFGPSGETIIDYSIYALYNSNKIIITIYFAYTPAYCSVFWQRFRKLVAYDAICFRVYFSR